MWTKRVIRPMLRGMASAKSPGGAGGKLSVLIFHRVLPEPDPLFPDEIDAARFDTMLSWLGGVFNVLPLSQAVQRLRTQSLPPRALSITFDDGYADNHDIALPILKRHDMVATFFIATGFLDGGRMWNDSLIESVRRASRDAIDLGNAEQGALPVSNLEEKRNAVARLLQHAKYLAPDLRMEMVSQVHAAAGASLPDDLMMSSQQVRAMRAAGMEIGAHTVSHPILTRLSAEAARNEIAGSRTFLQELLREPIDLFAYPNGKFGQDFATEHASIVAELGFSAAVATDPGVSSYQSDPFRLPRFTPWDRTEARFHARMIMNMK